ncbi:MAG: hypothetical protein IJ784_02075 [Ruminiclostridium sp.]|nr:hypothetical protein [Ruminiclostridium sp.]
MQITAFNPQIITKNAEPIIRLFEELGFEKRHTKKDIGDKNVVDVVMKNAEGFHLDISQPEMELPHDIQAIRINVRDFEETYDLLISRGFKNFYGDERVYTPSSKSAILLAPSGFVINLVEHIKDHN